MQTNKNDLPINNSINKLTKKNQCDKCKGCGLLKQEIITCNICNGIKCINCKETGFSQLPYETCVHCDGSGSIEK
jgi:hypothetical protein